MISDGFFGLLSGIVSLMIFPMLILLQLLNKKKVINDIDVNKYSWLVFAAFCLTISMDGFSAHLVGLSIVTLIVGLIMLLIPIFSYIARIKKGAIKNEKKWRHF